MSEKSLHRLLTDVARKRPFAFSDFYRRGRPVMRNPAPSPPQVTFIVTGRCVLGCSFCFASSATGRGVTVGAERLKPVFNACRGVEKAIILGGEPFEHPEIDEILHVALDCFSREVEVYTNGRLLPGTVEELDRYLDSLTGRRNRPSLVLTLAVDRYHADKLGGAVLEKRVDQFLALKMERRRKIRFNVSDEAFLPERYLARSIVEPVLMAASQRLAEHFGSLGDASEIEDSFYFNPVFRQGKVGFGERDALPLRLAELARGGDLVVGPDLGDTKKKERLALFSSLNAACAAPPPGSTVVGHLEGPDARGLQKLCLKALNVGELPYEASWVRNRLMEMHDDPARGWRRLASSLASVAEDPGELVLDAGLWTESEPVPFPVLHEMYRLFSERTSLGLTKDIKTFSGWFAGLLGGATAPSSPVFLSHWVDAMARIPADKPIRVPFGRICLDTGLGLWPGELAYQVHPEILVSKGPAVLWNFPGVAAAEHGESGPEDMVAWTRCCRLVLGEDVWGKAVPVLFKAIETRFPGSSRAKSILTAAVAEIEAPGQGLLRSGSRNPLLLFKFFAYDPRRGAVAWDDVRLLDMLRKERWPNWEESLVKKFVEELAAWVSGPSGKKGKKPRL